MANYPTLKSFEKYDNNGVHDATDDAFMTINLPITYTEFFEKFMLLNRPCIFTNFVTENWNCRKEWVTLSGQPNYTFLKQSFGHIKVPVADCGQEEYSAQPKKDMKFTDYIDYIVNYQNSSFPNQDRCLYLKDWHFTRDCPDKKAYETPVFFKSDWLNEYWDVRGDTDHDDYRFVYIGPKGSWTPFHADVFRSYSWSANICGRKKWIFYAPGEEEKLKDKFGNLIYDVTKPIDNDKYSLASQIKYKYEIIQEAGEVIFVPSGWHHQVINLEDTISINHNWLNGCCIENCWSFIKSSLLEVEKEISDCRDMDNWHQHCQFVTSSVYVYDFLGHIKVPVADCGQEEYSAQPKKDMKFTDYIDYIVNYQNSSFPNQDRCLYLKDWHFTRDCPDKKAYETPVFFKSDWLNEYWDVRGDTDHDDYRFVYIGPKGSWTPFHADVFRSYSWSANICGRKKWIFYAPGEEEKLKDKFGNLIYDVTKPIDNDKYSLASQIKYKYEIIQEAGEVIFVPSGWHHQVINLEDTISINHNWLNGCCIENCWSFIKSSLLEVEKEISDCRDMDNWHQHCQIILKASSGIDFTEFYMFMSTIARHRLDELYKLSSFKNSSSNDSQQNSLCDAKLDLGHRYTMKEPIDIPTKDMENCSLSDNEKVDRLLVQSNNTEKVIGNLQKCDKCDSGPSQLQKCGFQIPMCDIKYHWRYINAQQALFDLKKVKDVVTDMLEQSVFTILNCGQTCPPDGDHISTDSQISTDKNHFISKAKQLLCDIDLIIQKFK